MPCLRLLLTQLDPHNKTNLPPSGEHSARGFAADGVRLLRHQVHYVKLIFNDTSSKYFFARI